MKKSIYLCGFMGAGKTTIGKETAKLMGFQFVDLDQYIEQIENKSISVLFAQKGEIYFREKETEVLRELAGKGSSVVATGGGALITAQNAEILNTIGFIVYIDVSFDTCYSRIATAGGRPLVLSHSKEQLKALYNTRRPIYQSHAHSTVNGEKTPLECAKAIQNLYQTE